MKKQKDEKNTKKKNVAPQRKGCRGIFAYKSKKKRRYQVKQRTTGIYFLIWAIFTAMSLFIVSLFGISQQVSMRETYKREAAQEVAEKGTRIERDILGGIPSAFGNNLSGYLRFLTMAYDVNVLLLNVEGEVLFPQEQHVNPDDSTINEQYDFSEEMEKMLQQMKEYKTSNVVFECGSDYIYGSKITMYGDSNLYLYVGKSMALAQATATRMVGRTILIAAFVFVLVFAVSSAVSGWLINPLIEMKDKAHRLAQGDFKVDFKGVEYGREMVELAESLNFARDELSKADTMQKELIANVSHDFKTPLTMIKSYASMIMEISGDIPEKRNKHAQVIVDEADRLTSLVNDVLELSKMQSGLETLKNDLFDMSAYVYEIMDRFAYLKETQGYHFEADIDKELYVCADKLKIGQVLYNLIGNAVNYTGKDKCVFVSLKQEENGMFRFSVRDTGKGIPLEEQVNVWERYYRSAQAHKRPVKGTGLGLSIVKTVLEKHGFAFGVESEVGKGSTFYVLFPQTEIIEEREE